MDSQHKGLTPQTKTRFWVGVLWMENVDREKLEKIDEVLQGLPYVYCIHDKDYTEGDPQELRKTHIHMMFAYPGPTTYKQAMRLFSLFGNNAVNTCEPVYNVRYMYNYLTHDTKTCQEKRFKALCAGRKETKHLYSSGERISGNGFDIGLFEQLSTSEKLRIIKEMDEELILGGICDYSLAAEIFGKKEDSVLYELFLAHSAHFERMCKGIYLRMTRNGK